MTKFLWNTNFVSYNYKLNYATIIIIVIIVVIAVIIIIILWYTLHIWWCAHEFRKPNPTRNFQLCIRGKQNRFRCEPIIYAQWYAECSIATQRRSCDVRFISSDYLTTEILYVRPASFLPCRLPNINILKCLIDVLLVPQITKKKVYLNNSIYFLILMFLCKAKYFNRFYGDE